MSDTNLIITGKTGEAHISSADDGSLFGGIFGERDCILDRGSHLTPTLSGQVVTIASGDLVMQGRHARVPVSDTVTIQSPTNGTARYTDICAQYIKDLEDDSNESIKFVGINGAETSQIGNPPEPALEKGNIFDGDTQRDVRLCRVLYDTRQGTTSITLLTEGMNEFDLVSPFTTLTYSTEVPTSPNTQGLKIVVLDEDPETKYDGYLYLIKEM